MGVSSSGAEASSWESLTENTPNGNRFPPDSLFSLNLRQNCHQQISFFKNEEQEGKMGLAGGWHQWEWRRILGRGEGG
jgi:hypothetical protein